MVRTSPQELNNEDTTFDIRLMDELFRIEKDVAVTSNTLLDEEEGNLILTQMGLGLLTDPHEVELVVLSAKSTGKYESMGVTFLKEGKCVSQLQVRVEKFSGLPCFLIEKYYDMRSISHMGILDNTELCVGVMVEDVAISRALEKVHKYLLKYGRKFS